MKSLSLIGRCNRIIDERGRISIPVGFRRVYSANNNDIFYFVLRRQMADINYLSVIMANEENIEDIRNMLNYSGVDDDFGLVSRIMTDEGRVTLHKAEHRWINGRNPGKVVVSANTVFLNVFTAEGYDKRMERYFPVASNQNIKRPSN